MNLKRRILLEKIERLDQLSKGERKRALADPEHLISIGENNALKDIEELYPRTPTWDSLRDKVLARAARIEADTAFRSWQSLRMPNWYARAAFAVVFVAIICIVAMLIPQDRPYTFERAGASGRHVVVHYADSKNLFGHVFNP
jgi:hypothetical protein